MGIQGITGYTFRRTIITDIYEETHDANIAAAVAGHSKTTITVNRYAHAQLDAIVKGLRRWMKCILCDVFVINLIQKQEEVIYRQSKMHKKEARRLPQHTPQPLYTKQKTDLHLTSRFVELMTGFEPVTSSLPKNYDFAWRLGFAYLYLCLSGRCLSHPPAIFFIILFSTPTMQNSVHSWALRFLPTDPSNGHYAKRRGTLWLSCTRCPVPSQKDLSGV